MYQYQLHILIMYRLLYVMLLHQYTFNYRVEGIGIGQWPLLPLLNHLLSNSRKKPYISSTLFHHPEHSHIWVTLFINFWQINA